MPRRNDNRISINEDNNYIIIIKGMLGGLEKMEKGVSTTIEYVDTYEESYFYYFFKRIIDICGSLCGIIILSPIFIIIAVAIKMDSRRSVFFGQQRVGKNGKLFNMYKFRSMVTNAEELLDKFKDKNEMSGPMFKMKEDSRVIKIVSS
jgi:lipopolysaccharide/colanic/teichoic acid biosynthesis glycosyltransferase